MKKLFTITLSALMVLGAAACGASYDETVLPAADNVKYFAAGGWGDAVNGNWAPKEANEMVATSVAEVAKISKDVANKLAKKNLDFLYMKEVTLDDNNGNKDKALVNGEVVEFSQGHALKAIGATQNSEGTYTVVNWVNNPGDSFNAHAEALTDNIFIGPFQQTPDENGFDWNSNPVVTSEAGTYTFVLAKYKEVSSATVVGYGMAAIPKA